MTPRHVVSHDPDAPTLTPPVGPLPRHVASCELTNMRFGHNPLSLSVNDNISRPVFIDIWSRVAGEARVRSLARWVSCHGSPSLAPDTVTSHALGMCLMTCQVSRHSLHKSCGRFVIVCGKIFVSWVRKEHVVFVSEWCTLTWHWAHIAPSGHTAWSVKTCLAFSPKSLSA